MKIATIFFRDASTMRAYQDTLRARLYTAGYLPHQVTELFYLAFEPKKRTAIFSGRDDVERALDVAHEIRGVMAKTRDV